MTLISAETASGILGLSRPTVAKYAREGKIPVVGFMDGRYAIFERSAVEALKGTFTDVARPRRKAA